MSSLVKFPLDIHLKRFIAYVIICLRDKWLPQQINGIIRRKLMKAKNQLSSIEQWYRRATALDRNWRESRREEERLKGKKEQGRGALRQEQRQILL